MFGFGSSRRGAFDIVTVPLFDRFAWVIARAMPGGAKFYAPARKRLEDWEGWFYKLRVSWKYCLERGGF